MSSSGSTVVRLVTRLNVGGPAQQALLLTRALAGEFPTVLAAGRVGRAEQELSDPRVRVRHVPLVRPVRPVGDLAALRQVRRLLEEAQPAIVHTHMAKAGAIGRFAAATVRPPPRTVHTFHGHVLQGYFPAPVQRTFLEVERRLARQTDVLLAVSPQVRDSLLALGIGRVDQFHVVPLGLDLEPFLAVDGRRGTLRARLGLRPETPLVGVVGRLVPVKDHACLFRAVALLGDGVHLAVIGDGELRPSLQALAIRLRIADRVHFTGCSADVATTLSDMDVIALTSRNEGTPASLIEALASGRPVVATDVGGVRFVVEDGVSGHLVPPGNARSVAQALAALLSDGGLRRSMGEAGRWYVSRHFVAARLVEDIRQLYGQLLSGAL